MSPQNYDVFLSYCIPPRASAKHRQWVTTFKMALQLELNTVLGRTREFECVFDAQEAPTGNRLPVASQSALDHAEIFVALVSTDYLSSSPGRDMERKYFVNRLGDARAAAQRTFAVLLHENVKGEWEKQHPGDAIDFPFYEKVAVDKCVRLGDQGMSDEFFERVASLASDIAARISAIQAEETSKVADATEPASPGPEVVSPATSVTPPAAPAAPAVPAALAAPAALPRDVPTPVPAPAGDGVAAANGNEVPAEPQTHGVVMLAAVPGEIEHRRTELATFIKSKGWKVVPERNECSLDPEECARETEKACQDSVAFIQLLSRYEWPDHPFDEVQFNAAEKAGMVSCRLNPESSKLFYRYREEDVDMAKVGH